jgi:hypothetical protein
MSLYHLRFHCHASFTKQLYLFDCNHLVITCNHQFHFLPSFRQIELETPSKHVKALDT